MDKRIAITRKYYDKQAGSWMKAACPHFWYESEFKKFLSKLKPGGRVVDIGCANGIHVPMFLKYSSRIGYEGLDVSKRFVSIAKKRYPRVKFYIGDILSFKSTKKYQGFWAAAVFMHIPGELWPKLFTRLENLVEKGGLGFFCIPSYKTELSPRSDIRHFSFFTAAKTRKFLKSRGWKLLATGSKRNLGTVWVGGWRWYLVRTPEC